MKVIFENVDFNSSTGPNNFGVKLSRSFNRKGIITNSPNPDVRLAFIQTLFHNHEFPDGTSLGNLPYVLRLDGIFFNTSQDWNKMNVDINRSYQHADAVIIQSDFDKKLIDSFFGERDNCHIIRNGTDLEILSNIPKASLKIDEDKYDEFWLCASHWRPHKRLSDNIAYFEKFRSPSCAFLIAGKMSKEEHEYASKKEHVFYLGELQWYQLMSTMKLCSTFVHLAWLDHCPNVVVDARACDCRLVVSSAGGTVELTRENDIVVIEDEFSFEPVELYSPPPIDFTKIHVTGVNDIRLEVDIDNVAESYLGVLNSIIRK